MALIIAQKVLKNYLRVGSRQNLTRIGWLRPVSGTASLCYYDRDTDTIIFEPEDTNKVAPALEQGGN